MLDCLLNKRIEINISITQNLGVGKNMVNWGKFNTAIRKDIFFSKELKVFCILKFLLLRIYQILLCF